MDITEVEKKREMNQQQKNKMALFNPLLAITLLLYSGLSISADKLLTKNYICTEEKSVGFGLNKKTNEWKSKNYKAGEKLEITIRTSGKNISVLVGYVGDYPTFFCEDALLNEGTLYYCKGQEGQFRFNLKNLRFLKSHMYGYFGGDSSPYLPFISIGKCKPS